MAYDFTEDEVREAADLFKIIYEQTHDKAKKVEKAFHHKDIAGVTQQVDDFGEILEIIAMKNRFIMHYFFSPSMDVISLAVMSMDMGNDITEMMLSFHKKNRD